MKKIININLSGRVIPIEDSAYEKLQAYIESLRRYFANEDGRDEIINDIESRIAELMNDKIRLGSTAITDSDVSEIIASMGTIEDFEAVERESATGGTGSSSSSQQSNTAGNTSGNTYSYGPKTKNRLHRDSSDKILGGVCSGIANYLNIDPAIVRILFAIITIGGFGLGFLAYIILWIVLPPKDLDNYSGKRLYRNPDDKIIGGVAGGLAAYFGKETWVIRLIFSAPLLLNIIFGVLSWPFFHEGSFVPNIVFGSLNGTFIMAYIILWIVLPEANSQYQKMEMRGEKVDVNSIRQNVKEGMENMKDRMKTWSDEVKESAQNLSNKAREFSNTRGKTFAADVKETARRSGGGIAHIFGVIFKAFFLFIAGTIAFGLFVALLGLLFGGVGVWPIKNFFLDGFWENAFAWGTLVLFLGVPLIGFIVWLLRRIMRVKSKHNYMGWTFGGLWALGWVSVCCFVASLVNDFRMSNSRIAGTEMAITQPGNDRMIVTVTQPEVIYSGTLPWVDIDGEGMDFTKDTFKLANVRIRIEQSKDDKYHVEVKKYSRGRNLADAEAKAQNMKFDISYLDSILDVGSNIAVSKETKFRGQKAYVTIKVPVGKKIRFDENIHKLHAFNVSFRSYRTGNHRRSEFDFDSDDYFDYNANMDYTMGADGFLIDPSGVSVMRVVNDYRYKDSNDTIINKQKPGKQSKEESLEEKRRKAQDEYNDKLRKIDEEEKKNQRDTSEEKKTDSDVAMNPVPVFTQGQWF